MLVGRVVGLVALLAIPLTAVAREPLPARSAVYQWSANVAVAPAEAGRQRVETALAADGKGRVWLSYLDTEYKKHPDGKWIAWPRRVMLWSSTDQGATFANPRVLSEMGGDESLAVDAAGNLHAAWVQYFREGDRLKQRIVARRIGDTAEGDGPALECLPWEADTMAHDQSHLTPGADGTMHLFGTDIHPRHKGKPPLLHARIVNGGKACGKAATVASLGQLPQAAAGPKGLVAVGTGGTQRSTDGLSFTPGKPMPFGDKLVRVAASPDRKRVHVVGDNSWNGLWVYTSLDAGDTWTRSQVVTPGTAKAWRFPAVHVDGTGRVHVVWMDDHEGFGAIYHASSDDRGQTFGAPSRVSDAQFPFPAKAPPPPPGTQDGSWIGDYLSLVSVRDAVVVAWSDQRAGPTLSTVYVAVGRPAKR